MLVRTTRSLILLLVTMLLLYCKLIACQSTASIIPRYRVDKVANRVFGDGTTNGALNYPRAHAITESGEIFVSELTGIRKVNVNGTYSSVTKPGHTVVSVISGSIASQTVFANPGLMQISPFDGMLYVIESGNRIVQFNSSSGQLNVVLGKIYTLGQAGCSDGNSALDCFLSILTDFEIDPRNGDLYFVSEGMVRKLSKENNTVSFIGSVGSIFSKLSLVNDELYISNYDTVHLYNITSRNISLFATFPALTTFYKSIVDIEFCENGDYYYTSITGVYYVQKVGGNTTVVYSGSIISDISSRKQCSELYVTDNGKNEIYKIVNNGQTTLIAGNGKPGYVAENVSSIDGGVIQPNSLLVDDNGDLLIADIVAGRIRKVSSKTGLISTVVGNGNTTFNGHGLSSLDTNVSPYHFALSKTTRELYFSDSGQMIRKVNKESNTVEHVVGAMPNNVGDGNDAKFALLKSPTTAVPLSNGEIVISENGRIRKILNDGTITTLASSFQAVDTSGKPYETVLQATSLSVDSQTDDMYFVNYGLIGKYSNSTKSITVLNNMTNAATHLTLISSNELVYYSHNRVWKNDIRFLSTPIVIAGNGKVLQSTDNTNATGNSLGLINSMTSSNSGNVYISEGCKIRMISPSNNSIITIAGTSNCDTTTLDGVIAKGSGIYPTFIHFCEATGELYFVETVVIRKIGLDGRLYTVAGVQYPTSTPFLASNNPNRLGYIQHLSSNSDGDIFFTESYRNRAMVFRRNETKIQTLVNGDGDGSPTTQQVGLPPLSGIAFSKNGDLLISSRNVRRMSNSTGLISTEVATFDITQRGFSGSEIDDSFFTMFNSGKIYKITSNSVTLFAGYGYGYSEDGTLATFANLNFFYLSGLVQLPNGELYFQDGLRLRKIASDGRVYTIAGSGLRSNMEQNSYSDAMSVDLEYIQNLVFDNRTGKFYFIAGLYYFYPQVFSMTPYCPTGYVFEDVYKTKCMPVCFGITANQSNVCSGNGNCVSPNTCQCKDLYVGSNCSQTFCDTPAGKSNSLVCPSSQSSPSSNSTISSKTETVSNLQSLNAKTVFFTNVESVKIDLPSTFSDYLSTKVAEPIQLVSVVSKQDAQPVVETNSQDNSTLTTTVLTSVVTLLFLKTSDGGKVNVQNLTKPISFSFTNITFLSVPNSNSTSTLVCSYFDEVSSSWKFDGLEIQITHFSRKDSSITFSATCQAYHLTSFVIMDKNLKKNLNTNGQELILDMNNTNVIVAVVVSVVGGLCVLGVVGAILVIVCVILSKRKRMVK